MTVKKHNGRYVVGTIVGYSSHSGAWFHAYKLLKATYIPEIADFRWIAQYGKVLLSEGKFVPDDSGAIFHVLTDKEIKATYHEVWTPQEFKKGDILEGEDADGTRVLFFYEDEDRVHRLTPYVHGVNSLSWGSLALYKRQIKGLRALKTTISTGEKRFSEI